VRVYFLSKKDWVAISHFSVKKSYPQEKYRTRSQPLYFNEKLICARWKSPKPGCEGTEKSRKGPGSSDMQILKSQRFYCHVFFEEEIIKMTNHINPATPDANVGVDPIVIETINHISGAHAALFWDILYGTSESILAMENTEAVLAFLYDGSNFGEAFMLIRAYYELLGIEWPEEMFIIERIGELKEPFVYEFLLDAEDIILDFKFNAEEQSTNQPLYS
jgi:hypothetical protein